MRVCPKCRAVYGTLTQHCGLDGERLVQTDRDPLLGTALGRYQVIEMVGRGASGGVYRARHQELGTEFAIKVLGGDLGADESMVGRFRREAQVASGIRSSNVVSVIDFCRTEQGLSYIVMELALGTSLAEVIRHQSPLPRDRILRLGRDVAAGLAAAHNIGVVHRDVKPANIIVVDDGGRELAKILDFGIARIESEEMQTRLTGAGQILGTPPYMAPEQWRGSRVGPGADLYSLGIVLYEMVAGRRPFVATEVAGFLHMHIDVAPPPLPTEGQLESLIMRLLAKSPDERPASATELANELDSLVTGGTFTAYAPTISSSGLRAGAPPPRIDTDARPAEFSTLPPPAVKGPSGGIRIAVGVAAVAIAATAGLAWWSQSGADEPVPVLAAQVSKIALEARLDAELSALGLSDADLSQLPGVNEAVKRFRSADEHAPVELQAAFDAALKRLSSDFIEDGFLQSKLDRLDGLLAQIAERSPQQREERLEQEYLDLYRIKNAARTPGARTAVARSIAAFEKKLEAAVAKP